MNKRTKIVCTLGPSCESVETITNMVKAGMNVVRLNFSHGTYENHAMLIEHVREVEKKTGEPIAILQDLQGPKIRVGVLPKEGVEFVVGKTIVFDTGATEYKNGVIPVDYPELHTFVKKGERLLLNDGRTETRITEVAGTKITVEVTVPGLITSHKGINLPDSHLTVRALTDKDADDARFGVEHGVDFIALSFVTKSEDVLDLRFRIKKFEDELGLRPEHPIRIIAKIERQEAVNRIEEIIQVVDGIMIARGDLGVEMPAAEVPLIQKRLIDIALRHSKSVIVATQMLDSMQENPRPTRAEVSDVANAVIDHTDAVMLSNETATGKYPVETVKMMAEIVTETESSVYDDMPLRSFKETGKAIDSIISELSRMLAERISAKLILSASLSGDTGRLLSRYRPELPIVVGTSDPRVQHQLALSWGVVPFILEECASIEELVERSVLYLKRKKMVKKEDEIIVVAGEPVGHEGHINLLEVREVE